MINKMKCMFSRLAAQFLKPTLALLAALAVGGAWADAETIANTLSSATAADDVVVTLAGETVAVNSITAASLTVNGYGKINVAGNVTVSGELAFYPSSAVSSDIQASEGAYTLKLNVEGSVSSGSIAGGGTIDAAMGVTTSGGTFYGAVTGATTLNITANATLQGRNNLTGGLNISGGITTLGAYDYSQLVKFDFDTTDRSRWTVDSSDNSVSKLWTKTGGCPGGQLAYSHFESYGSSKAIVSQSESIFGNQPYLALVDGVNYSYQNSKTSRGRANAWLAVYRVENSSGAGKLLFEGNNSSNNGYLNLNSSAVWASRSNGGNNDSLVFVDGVRTTQGEFGKAQTVMSFTGVCVNDNRFAVLTSNNASYPGITGALGQIIGFETRPSVEQYLAINAIMMQKWKCDYPEKCQILPTTAPVTLSSGAVLDLNNYKETIKSISGSGTVQNGTLTVTDAINLAAGDVLTLPTSATFTLGTVAAKVVNGDAVTLYGSVADAINGYTAGTLTVYATETVAINKEVTISGIVFENGATISLNAVPPFVATLEGDTLTCVRGDGTFVYVGPTAYSATAGNFKIGGVATDAVPGSSDTVQFDTATSIYIGNANIQYAAFVLNADVTVTGAGTKYLRVNRYTGTGVLKLAGNGNLAPQDGSTTTIECPVDISGDNILRVPAQDDVTTIKGKLTGSGKWKMSRVGGNTGYTGNIFRCDASEFTGTIEELPCDSNVSRNFTRFGAPDGSNVCDFSGATVTLNSNRNTGKGKFLWVNTSTVTYKFGSLKGKVTSTASEYTNDQHCYIEIGALGDNDELTGDWISGNSSRNPYLRKVGTGTLTTSVTDTYGYILNGGTLVVMAAAAQKPVTTELSGYEVVSTVNYDTEGADPTVVLSTTYTLRSTVPTWTGAGSDNKWSTAENWNNGLPTSSSIARFPAGTWTVFIDTDAAACAGMDVLGTVEFAQTDRSVNVHNAIAISGNVTGSGTVKLTHVGLNNASGAAITFSPNLEVLAPAANTNSDSWLTGEKITLSGMVSATGRICLYNANTFTGTINVAAGGSFDARADQTIDGANAIVNINGWFGVGFSGTAKWLFTKNGAVINLNAGGTLSLCRITGAGYTLNFNGGTLNEYGDGYDKDKIIGGRADSDDGVITLNVKSLGLKVDTATATTITPALLGDSESTGGGLTKKGSGALTLAATPTYTGTTTVEAGTLIVPASASLTLGENTIVSARDANTITLANATTVNVTGLTHEHATATVTAGGESVTVTEGVAVVPVGSNVVITWTAESGYQITANGTQNIDNIREAGAATAPTVSGTTTISAPTVDEYGNDFATVSVTARVTSTYPAATTITYTLKANGTAIATTTAAGDATSVTFTDANVSSLTRYGNISYTVEASGESVTAASSDATTVMFADTIGWVKENYQTTTTAAAGGAWQTAVTYDSETHKAAVVDNRFSATNCTTGDVVTVTIDDVVYTSLSDLTSADTDAQGAVAVGGTEKAPKFMLLTKQDDTVGWYEAAGVTPDLENGVYDIVMTFDYNSNTYTVTVNGTPLKVDNIAAVPLAKAQTSVKNIDFLGAGSLAAINGVQYEGKMAIDQNGRKYATVAEALEANASVKGAVIKLLHGSATTSAEGWNFDSDTKTFVKKVIGLIFLAF